MIGQLQHFCSMLQYLFQALIADNHICVSLARSEAVGWQAAGCT